MNPKCKMPLVLIVEDEEKLATLLVDYLKADGFDAEVVADGRDAVLTVRVRNPALVLLDLNLPGRNGIEICRELRSFTEIPIIIVTARVEEIDRILGLNIGADDYICKPFSPREVVARVRAILRRSTRSPSPSSPSGLLIDTASHTASLDGRKLDLTPVEFRLLVTLAENPSRVYSRDQLLDCLYSHHRAVTDRTVDSHIKNLRRKLSQASPDLELVRSIYGVGYTLKY
jgi:two-component system response regulator BaeR